MVLIGRYVKTIRKRRKKYKYKWEVINLYCFKYALDVVLIVKSSIKLQVMIKVLRRISEMIGLKMNIGKIKIMTSTRKHINIKVTSSHLSPVVNKLECTRI